MILGCPQCRTRFRIDDTKVRSDGVKVRCSRCAHVFWATPEQGEPEVGATTSTRRVDAAALIALALESDPDAAGAREPDLAAPAPSPAPSSNPTQELPLSEGDPGLIDGLDEADLFFPVQDQGPPPDLDEVRGALEASGDLFDALDRAAEPPEPFDAPHDELLDGPGARFDPSDAFGAPSAGDASAFPPAQIPDALRGASVDLPPAAPPTSSFLDDGSARPSTDLELAEALESDFFSERALPVPEMA